VKWILVVVVAVLLKPSSLAAATSVWIDTDPSVARGGHEVDDGFALIQAFHSPALAIRGVSVVFGNAPLAEAFPIGQRLVHDFGPPDLPVYRGAASAQQRGVETGASRALAAALRREELVVIVLGPATNVATVLQLHPELGHQIKQIVAVAGRRPHQRFSTEPSVRAFRDFNFEMDPAAFQVLLDSRVPLVLAPWEISSKVWIREPDLHRLRSANPSLGWVLDAAADWLQFWRKDLAANGFNPFDTLAVGYVTSPSGFRCQQLPVRIERLPDDTATGKAIAPEKPYLLLDQRMQSKQSALYCSEAPAGFLETLLGLIAPPGAAPDKVKAFDDSIWNELARKYINTDFRVDYRALAAREAGRLDTYLQQFARKWPPDLTQAEQKAALINAYNAFTVHWILSNYPVQSIWKTKHPFTAARNALDGGQVSLDQIESRLRAMGDPRIHAALVCASRSCPPLRREAYAAARIDQQLDDNFRTWLANKSLNVFSPQKRTASVSMIFKWYANDFRKAAGSVEKILARYAPAGTGDFLLAPGSRLEYKTYHWGLNDASSLGSDYSRAAFYWDALRNK
jgi:pyrimidine-specific ribonucleoside hydrolase